MPKIGRDYSMYNKEGRPTGSIERAQHTQLEQGYFEGMAGEAVRVHLTTSKEIEGTLRASTYNRYDIMVENEEGRFLVPKAAILYVKHCKGGDIK